MIFLYGIRDIEKIKKSSSRKNGKKKSGIIVREYKVYI